MSAFKNKNYIFAIFFLCLLASLTLYGSEKYYNDDGIKYLIGVSEANLSEPWRVQTKEDIKNEAYKYGNTKVIFTDAGNSSLKQKNDINKLLGYGIDILIVSINDANELAPIIEKSNKKIPVIVIDKRLAGSGYFMYIGYDNKKIGRNLGEISKKLLDNRGKVVELLGNDSSTSKDISSSFRQELSNSSKISIVKRITANWEADKAEDELLKYLKHNRNIDLIVSQGDAMALGAYKAIRNENLRNVKVVAIGGQNKINGGVNLVSQGILDTAIICPTAGSKAVKYAMEILNNKKNIPKNIELKMYIKNKTD